MAKAARTEPPPDPDFGALGLEAWRQWNQDQPDVLAFDTETTGLQFHDTPFCVTVAWTSPEGWPTAHYLELGVPLPGRHWPDGRQATTDDAVAWMLANTPLIVGHNIKFDLQKLQLVGLLDRAQIVSTREVWGDKKLTRIADTQALAHLDDEHRAKALKSLAVEVLGYDDTIKVEITSGPNKGQTRKVPREKHELDAVRRKLKVKKDDGFQVLPRAVILPYALKDAEFTLDLYEHLDPLVHQHEDLSSLYDQEMELTLVFLDMETAGIGVNLPYVRDQITEYTSRVLQTEQRIEGIVGRAVISAVLPETPPEENAPEPFNPNSNPQIAEFFSHAGYEREKYDAGVLETLDHPLAPALLELRSDLKILNTYFRAIQRGTVDGVFHPSFRQHGTVTGRTSSGAAKAD